MMQMTTFMAFVMFLTALVCFTSNWTHIMSTLISLEFLVLSIFLMLAIYSMVNASEIYTTFFYLALTACEGALGISILIMFTRSKGSELSDNSNLLTW